MNFKTAACVTLLAFNAFNAVPALIGTNIPAAPLTAERVARLPERFEGDVVVGLDVIQEGSSHGDRP